MRPPEEPNFVVLTPYDPKEGMTLKQAAGRAGKSETTVKNWCLNRGLGRRVGGGVWVVSRVALEMFLDGNETALLLYHEGRFDSPEVRSYFDRAAVPFRKIGISDTARQEASPPAFSTISARIAG